MYKMYLHFKGLFMFLILLFLKLQRVATTSVYSKSYVTRGWVIEREHIGINLVVRYVIQTLYYKLALFNVFIKCEDVLATNT